MVVGVVSNTGGTPARSLGGVAFFEAVFFGHRLVNRVCGSGPPGSPLFKGGSWARCVLALFVVKAFGLNESVALARRVAPLSGGAPGSVASWPHATHVIGLAAVILTSAKLVVAFITGSLGVLSEALHSGVDLAGTVLSYTAVRMSDRPPDATHPYGHARAARADDNRTIATARQARRPCGALSCGAPPQRSCAWWLALLDSSSLRCGRA